MRSAPSGRSDSPSQISGARLRLRGDDRGLLQGNPEPAAATCGERERHAGHSAHHAHQARQRALRSDAFDDDLVAGRSEGSRARHVIPSSRTHVSPPRGCGIDRDARAAFDGESVRGVLQSVKARPQGTSRSGGRSSAPAGRARRSRSKCSRFRPGRPFRIARSESWGDRRLPSADVASSAHRPPNQRLLEIAPAIEHADDPHLVSDDPEEHSVR